MYISECIHFNGAQVKKMTEMHIKMMAAMDVCQSCKRWIIEMGYVSIPESDVPALIVRKRDRARKPCLSGLNRCSTAQESCDAPSGNIIRFESTRSEWGIAIWCYLAIGDSKIMLRLTC